MFTVTQEKYNGWNSYATWRVMNDYFNQFELDDMNSVFYSEATVPVREIAKSYVEEVLEHTNESYVLESFLDEVDWEEVERAIQSNYEEMNEYA